MLLRPAGPAALTVPERRIEYGNDMPARSIKLRAGSVILTGGQSLPEAPNRAKSGVRVGFNASFYGARKVGVDVFIENLVRGLSRVFRMTVYTSEPAALAHPGITVRRIPGWTRNYRGRFLWVHTALPGLLARDRADVVLSPFVESPVVRIPSVAVVHDLTPLLVPRSCPPGYTFLFWLSLRILRRATLIVTDSEHTRDDVGRAGLRLGAQVRTIPLGTSFGSLAEAVGREPGEPIRAQLTGRGLNPSRPFVLYVGGFPPHKRVPLLLSAFKQLCGEFAHQLVLVGFGTARFRQELAREIELNGLQDRVTVLEDVSDRELACLYMRCDAFVCPSEYEGFGLPVLEAMACGAPVVCSDAASLPEVAGDAAVYFSLNSRDGLVMVLRAVLSDPALRAALAVKGRMRAREFTWDRTAAAYAKLLFELAGSGRG